MGVSITWCPSDSSRFEQVPRQLLWVELVQPVVVQFPVAPHPPAACDTSSLASCGHNGRSRGGRPGGGTAMRYTSASAHAACTSAARRVAMGGPPVHFTCALSHFVLSLRVEQGPARPKWSAASLRNRSLPKEVSHEICSQAVRRSVVSFGFQPPESPQGKAEPRGPSAAGGANSVAGFVAAVGR